jgi:hypothetical protein
MQTSIRVFPPAWLLVLAVGACASVEAVPAKLQAIKTVGVVSAVADQFTFTQAGLTGLESADRSVSIEPWSIDDLIVSRAGVLLSKRFQVQTLTYRRAAFAARESNSPIAVANLLREDPVKALVRAEITPQGLDAYVVITKATAPSGSRGRPVTGIGIINHSAVFGSHAQLHALYEIRVIDGHTFDVIGKKSASPLDNSDIARLSGPSRMVDASLATTANDVTANEQLKAAVTELIERSLEPTLRDLRL